MFSCLFHASFHFNLLVHFLVACFKDFFFMSLVRSEARFEFVGERETSCSYAPSVTRTLCFTEWKRTDGLCLQDVH